MAQSDLTTADLEQQARELLTSPQAAELVRHALGTQVAANDVAIQKQRIHHRPGMGLSMDYDVSYYLGDQRYEERMVASTASNLGQEPANGVAYLHSGHMRVAVWRMRDDPFLPGLHTAFNQQWVSQLFDQVNAPPGELTWQILAYRPTRRAVIRITRGGVVLYLKVVPARKLDDLAKRMHMVSDAVPAPEVIATTADGVVAAASARGHSLAHALVEREVLPSPSDILQLIRNLPAQAVNLPRRPSWSDRIDFHAKAAASRLPEHAERIDSLCRRLEWLRDHTDAGPLVATHGDLYEANMFVHAGEITGLIDVDSLGPGHIVDDVATLLAHLAVLPDLAPRSYPQVADLVQEWWSEFTRSLDPVALTVRSAAVILSLVAGGERNHALARLELAEMWAAHAEQLSTPVFSSSLAGATAHTAAPDV